LDNNWISQLSELQNSKCTFVKRTVLYGFKRTVLYGFKQIRDFVKSLLKNIIIKKVQHSKDPPPVQTLLGESDRFYSIFIR
jgi:hypothetical protein